MAVFSDSDSDIGETVTATKRAASSRSVRTKKNTVVNDDFGSEFSEDDIMEDENDGDDGSDFEMEDALAPKKKAVAAKKSTGSNSVKKPPAKKKAKSASGAATEVNDEDEDLPLQPLSDLNGTHTNPQRAKNASAQYQKLSQLEHILKRPDTYIGSIEKTESLQWVYDTETKSMVHKNITIVPGLYKIFDEILVNAADNKTRDPSMNLLEVDIDPETNTISVKNNGKGIPVEIHDKEKIYIPELIFGTLLTSSNYDDDEKKVTGGRNGFGAKVSICNSTDAFFFSFTNSWNCSYVIFFRQSLSLRLLTRIAKRYTSRLGITACPRSLNPKLQR
jgi:DNA topoisomerase-2